jgi:EAL domain-containing protein (putative c-di-GMP-specific phosphodiesterase class I)/GGDEF domain-containing protein
MPASLTEALPDLIVLVERAGTVLACTGGAGVGRLKPADPEGRRLETLWPAPVAELLKQLVRKAIATRSAVEVRFQDEGRGFEVRVSAQGPDRAICVLRPTLVAAREDSLDLTDERPRPQLDRRGFLKRFKETVSVAALHEKRMALAVIHVDGITDIGQVIAAEIAERVMSVAILRLPNLDQARDDGSAGPWWYLGQLSENLLALVLESADREAIEACVTGLCASLREPVGIGNTEFHLTPFAGVAILGQDSASPRALLDHARSSATEARRSGSKHPRFFTDTLQVRSLARLDIARELRDAIANGEVGLRYIGRHDLHSGRLVTWAGYLRWLSPLRGEIRPVEFLKVAEATGLATLLSRAALVSLRQDFAAHASRWDGDIRISFGPLRHHVLHKEFVDDILEFLDSGAVPPERLELRIAEKAFIARAPGDFDPLAKRGVRLLIDEVGRGMASLDWLARARIWGLQLDRAWVGALLSDPAALKVCSAGIAVANALGLTPVATGIDDQSLCDALLALGCRQGAGDLFQGAFPEAAADLQVVAAI